MSSIKVLRLSFTPEQQHHNLFYSPVLGRLVVDFEVSILGVVEQSNFKSPHTITSGLLSHGDLNQSFSDGGLLYHGVTNHD